MIVSLLDGYIDEPSSLGVPPFLSPLARYMAGAIIDAGHEVRYLTVDSYRASGAVRDDVLKADMLVVIAGVTVPGRYIRGAPLSPREAVNVAAGFKGMTAIAGFMAGHLAKDDETSDAFDLVLKGPDPDAQLYDSLKGGLCAPPGNRKRTADEWGRWAVKGASVVGQHPDFPQPLIAEVDVYKGCIRFHSGGCSFCSEILLGPPRFRDPEDVAAEVGALARAGVTNFRLACPCMFSYKAKGIGTEEAFPSPEEVEALLSAVVAEAKGMRILHVDNADPGMIARYPEESGRILRSLVKYCTSGNILSLGMESADPAVIKANNLNSTPKEVLEAIRLVNKAGAKRGPTGLPDLLPGINFIAGLDGETSGTYKMDLDFLRTVLDEGLLVRRINIRQVMEVRAQFPGVKKRKDFMRFKEAVRECIDRPMLEKLLPRGTVLRDLYVERKEGKLTYARQVGSYPILVGIPGPVDRKGFFDGAIVDWGQRSVTALPSPLDINSANMALLSALPGIGKKRAARLIRARPFKGPEDLAKALDDPKLVEGLRPFISFS
jgi:radical SAM superfamily enzyme with C-terminal helix-hairpin-helix motif